VQVASPRRIRTPGAVVVPPLPAGTAAPRRGTASLAATRAFDVVFALAASALTAPVVAVAMLAIRLDSPGPALFRQRRMGRDGEVFELVKLRGMYVDAPQRYAELYDYAGVRPDASRPYYFHRREDPRITRVGRRLRRYSIDELPNFWNVLRGEMSVVGPRPEIPELAHLYGADLALLLSVRPGVTSPAKACGRDALSFEETVARELEYVRTRSLLGDLRTIVMTANAVVRGADAC
jgi:lipopolysaccharide/colanic/teichoic acid biosynthesis glycosyltransferase